MKNYDLKTVNDFGNEWSEFSQEELSENELRQQFERYFKIVEWKNLPKKSKVFDMGCGSGRWAKLVASRVGSLYCIDASEKALNTTKKNLNKYNNCYFYQASFENIPLDDESMDFGYSLGVLHHIPDTFEGIHSCVNKLKPGAPFLAYIYYAFDNKPEWFRIIWKCSDIIRRFISKFPFRIKVFVSQILAFLIYYPLARISFYLEKMGFNVENIPLSAYRNLPFYSMKTDSLDRFGTRLEKRFTKKEIVAMYKKAGLENIIVSNDVPYWCVLGYKK